MNIVYYLKPLTTLEVVDGFIKCNSTLADSSIARIHDVNSVLSQTAVSWTSSPTEIRASPAYEVIQKVSAKAVLCATAQLQLNGNNNWITYRYDSTKVPPSPYATLTLAVPQPPYNEELTKLKLIEAIPFNLINPSQVESKLVFTPETTSSLSAYQVAVAEMGSVTSRFGSAMIEQEKRINEFLLNKADELEKRHAAKLNEVDLMRTTAQNEIDLKRVQLDSDRTALAEEVKKVNDRSNMHMRRKILEEIEDPEFLKGVELSPKTNGKRNLIHGVFITTILCLMTLAIAFATKIMSDAAEPNWRLFLPLAAGTIGFATTILFYIKWNDAWMKEHARAELYRMRVRSDLKRVSWLAEMLLEWKEKKEIPFPPEVVSAMTQNLFADDAFKGEVNHPLEQLLAAAANAKKLKVDKGTIEIEK